MFTKSMATSLTIVSLFASIALAQDTQRSAMGAPRPSSMNVYDPVGWFPFIGVAGGYISPDDDLKTEGAPGDIKLIGSYFGENRNNVLDLGLGFTGTSFTEKSDTQNNFIGGGLAEVAWRYNSENRWQVGPIVDAFIGGGDRFGSTDPTWTTFGGLQLLKEFPVRGSNMFRVGVKALTGLSITQATINTVSLDLQWGFGAEQRAPALGATDTTSSRSIASESDSDYSSAAASTEETDSITGSRSGSTYGNRYGRSPSSVSGTGVNTGSGTSVGSGTMSDSDTAAQSGAVSGAMTSGSAQREIQVDPEDNAVILKNDAHMQFTSGSSTLSTTNANFVKNLGQKLSQQPDLFDKVEVIGLADQTGPSQTSKKVSKARADQVAKLLSQGGLKKSKIDTTTLSSDDPEYKSLMPEDSAQSQRVDLKFHDVKDQKALDDLLSSIE